MKRIKDSLVMLLLTEHLQNVTRKCPLLKVRCNTPYSIKQINEVTVDEAIEAILRIQAAFKYKEVTRIIYLTNELPVLRLLRAPYVRCLKIRKI